MNFCSECAHPVVFKTPPGDHLPRFLCENCGTIHYQNPRIIAGCVPEYHGEILLCRRAIEPRVGFWTIPAGFMENGETIPEAAARECMEEALADVTIGSLLSIVHVEGSRQVHIFFRAQMKSLSFGAGPESLEAQLVKPADIPWQDLAFPSTEYALRRYLEDKAAGREDLHIGTVGRIRH